MHLGRAEAQTVRVVDHLLRVLWKLGHEDVEEVLSVGELALWEAVGEVPHHSGVLPDPRIDVLDRALVVLGNVDLLQFRHLEELLLLGQHLADEVLRDHPVGREVALLYTE